jgi:hypothetical protein
MHFNPSLQRCKQFFTMRHEFDKFDRNSCGFRRSTESASNKPEKMAAGCTCGGIDFLPVAERRYSPHVADTGAA